MATATSILASLTVTKSDKHTHYTSHGYFICPTHQNDRKVTMPEGTEVTCSKCKRRLLQLQEHAKQEAAEAAQGEQYGLGYMQGRGAS